MLEALGALVAMGIVGWLIILAVWAATVAISEYERVEVLGYAFIAVVVGLYFWQHINVPLWMWEHLGTITTWAIVWLAIGTVWSFWKWDRFCAKARARYDDLVGCGEIRANDYQALQKAKPRALQSKRKFLTWIILWPQSAFWYVFSDLIHDLVDIILRQLAGVYDRIANRHFRDITIDPLDKAVDQAIVKSGRK